MGEISHALCNHYESDYHNSQKKGMKYVIFVKYRGVIIHC
jgi:hypothetical protein